MKNFLYKVKIVIAYYTVKSVDSVTNFFSQDILDLSICLCCDVNSYDLMLYFDIYTMKSQILILNVWFNYKLKIINNYLIKLII